MTKRWISLYVENQIGVLAKISGLFSGKSYNLESLTVGPTGNETISRVTIGLISDDATFEQVKKQLSRCVEVITVIDFTNKPILIKELMFIKIKNCTAEHKNQLFQIAQTYQVSPVDYGKNSLILECVLTEAQNDHLIKLLNSLFGECEVVRGGSVAIESI